MKYKKYLLSAFVLFMMYAVMSPHTTSAFWPFDWFKKSAIQKSENYAGAVVAAPGAQGVSPDQLVKLLISLGVISPDKAIQAMKTLTSLSPLTKVVTVLSPNGGEKWTIGNVQTITWSSPPALSSTFVSIALVDQTNGYAYAIADGQPNNGVFTSRIVNDLQDNNLKEGYYKVRVSVHSNANDFLGYDESDAPFSLKKTPVSNNPHAEWSLVNANAIGIPGVVGIASSSVVGTITLKAKSSGGELMKRPIAGDFTVIFASSTKKNGDYNTANSITVIPTIQVFPMDSFVGGGDYYTVTLTGVIYSSNPLLGSSQPLFMAIKDIDSVVEGILTTNQTWGIDNFYTNPVQLTKSEI